MSRPRLRLAELLNRGMRGPSADLVEYLRRHEPPRPPAPSNAWVLRRGDRIRSLLASGVPALVVTAVGLLLVWRGALWLGILLVGLAGMALGVFAWWFGVRLPAARLRLLREGRLRLGTIVARRPAARLEGTEQLLVVFPEEPGRYRELSAQGPASAFVGLDRGGHVVVLFLDDPWPAGLFTMDWQLLLGRLGGSLSMSENTKPSRPAVGADSTGGVSP